MELIGNNEDKNFVNTIVLKMLNTGLVINIVIKIRKPVEDY